MFNLLHLLLVVATQITRSWCLHDTTQTIQPQHQTTITKLYCYHEMYQKICDK